MFVESPSDPKPEDGCGICSKKAKSTSRDMVMVYIGDEGAYLCRACYKDYIEACRTLFNGMRRLLGKKPRVFHNFMR